MRQSDRARGPQSRRNRAGPGLGRGDRLLPRGPRGRRRRARDRSGHDRRHDRASPRERGAQRGLERGIPAGRDRAPAGRRRERGRDHLELRRQPVAGQAAGLPRGDARAEARRTDADQRPRPAAAAEPRAPEERGPLRGMRRRRLAQGGLPVAHARRRLRRRRGGEREPLHRRPGRAGRGKPGTCGFRLGRLGDGGGAAPLRARGYSNRRAAGGGDWGGAAAAPKRGGRFSTKARRPSAESGVAQHASWARASASRHSSSVR